MAESNKPPAIVIVGVGGMGLSIAKRIGPGSRLILADYSEDILKAATEQLENDGHVTQQHKVDVADMASVKKLAADAAASGRITTVVATAGLSPVQAPPQRIFDVDLLGTANVIEAFQDVLAPGGSLVCIASMAGHNMMGKLPPEAEKHFAHAPVEKLLSHDALKMGAQDSNIAYCLSKRANQLRVEGVAKAYGKRGCRINSISPGVIFTPMVKQELEGPGGKIMRGLITDSASQRFGTPSDITALVAFLVGNDASFITGTDILVDGGSTSSQRWGGEGSVKSMSLESSK